MICFRQQGKGRPHLDRICCFNMNVCFFFFVLTNILLNLYEFFVIVGKICKLLICTQTHTRSGDLDFWFRDVRMLVLPLGSSRHPTDIPIFAWEICVLKPQQPRTDIHFVFISKTLHELIYLWLISGQHHTSTLDLHSTYPCHRPCLSCRHYHYLPQSQVPAQDAAWDLILGTSWVISICQTSTRGRINCSRSTILRWNCWNLFSALFIPSCTSGVWVVVSFN